MKTYKFKNRLYGGGKSSGFPGLGKMVFDIIKDWTDNHPVLSLGDLITAFPQELRGSRATAKDALFASKQDAENRSRPRHVRNGKEFLTIRLGDESEYAVSDQWGDLPSGNAGAICVFVEHARKMGCEIEELSASPQDDNPANKAAREQPIGEVAKPSGKRRYRETAASKAQNMFLRHILSNLGNESFSKQEWESAKAYFGEKCAYCGESKQLEMDHAVPTNAEHMGEHRLGNLVPSCRECNSAKHNQDFRDFLADNDVARQAIEEYMRMHGYTPIKDREDAAKMREVMEIAYREIKPLAERYIRILNSMLD